MVRQERHPEPNAKDVSNSLNRLKNIAEFGSDYSTLISETDCIILMRYIKFLEDQLASVIPEFIGIPTEYFNMVRREKLEWRPLGSTPIF